MNLDYICPHCNAIYREKDLANNDDGICIYCGTPLQALEVDPYFPACDCDTHKPKYFSTNPKLNNMLKNLQMYPMNEVWHSIELLKKVKDRIEERKLFFEALKKLNKKFELWEE